MSETLEGEYTALAVREATPLARNDAVPMPIVTTSEAKAQMVAYTAMVAAVLNEDDYQKIWGQPKPFKKKSGVKKLQTFFGLKVEIVDDAVRDDLGDGHFGFRVKARATAPNGRSVEALAACSTLEERFDLIPKDNDDVESKAWALKVRKANARSYHDVLATAETRATNRAVLNLIGAGEVSAEEMREPRQESLVERAARLGIGNLRDWCQQNGVLYNQRAITDALDARDAAAHEEPPWRMNDQQRKLLMALHTKAGHRKDSDRYTFYEGVLRREPIRSSTDLTCADFDKVLIRLEELTRDSV